MSVIVDITVSVDGFVTGPNDGVGNGLGDRGLAIHRWAIDSENAGDRRVLESATAHTAVVVMGRHLFDVIDAPDGWNDERGYGADAGANRQMPYIVVTSEPPAEVRLGLDFHFVTEGVEAAIARAVELAGDGRVVVMGGGEVCRSVLAAGLADELHLHISPLVLGAGTPLWAGGIPTVELELQGSDVTPSAVHVRYAVRNDTRQEW